MFKQKICINIDSLPYQKLYDILQAVKSIPAEKLSLTNCNLETFEMIFENYLCEEYPIATFIPNKVNTYVLYHKTSTYCLTNKINPILENSSSLPSLNTYYHNNTAYIVHCADTSAGVSSKADTKGNKQVEVDISSTSDDGKYSVKASATYQEDKYGEKTGSAQLEARIKFGD